jgi:hypothetical protein
MTANVVKCSRYDINVHFEVIVTNLDLYSTSKNSPNLLNRLNSVIAHLSEYEYTGSLDQSGWGGSEDRTCNLPQLPPTPDKSGNQKLSIN